jgi:hypothetical protein
MTGREQAKLLSTLLWVLTALQLFGVVVFAVIFVAAFGISMGTMPNDKKAPPPEFFIPFMGVVFLIVVLVTILYSIPKVVAGYGLRKEKSWAKIWTIIACIVGIMNVPFGTAVGVYGLIFIFGDEGKAYFDSLEAGRREAEPARTW